MAGSRREKIGTIFSRVRGLLRSGALQDVDKPVWYDVYKTFPPITAPQYERFREEREPRSILYKEDMIRAKFFNEFGSPGITDMMNPDSKLISERFIEEYNSLSEKDWDESTRFNMARDKLCDQGITLKTVEDINKEKKLRLLRAQQANELAQSNQVKRDKTVTREPMDPDIFDDYDDPTTS